MESRLKSTMVDLVPLAAALRDFSAIRDWDQFHTPKNLAMALSVEAAELLELFQWLTPEQSAAVRSNPEHATRVAEELADVLVYLVRLADVLNIDLNTSVLQKLKANSEKYPVDRAKGSAAKYTEYDP
jgi:dCTP diphosphatase